LGQFIEEKKTSVRLGIEGEKYTGALENGRNPTKSSKAGSPTLKEVIRKWIDDKNIVPKGKISKDSLAFLIARKIHKEGIKVPNKYNKGGLVSNVVTKKRIAELNKSLSLYFIKEFKSEIIKELKDGN